MASFSVKDATADDKLVVEMGALDSVVDLVGAIVVEASSLEIKFGNVIVASFCKDAGTVSGSFIAI